LIERATIIFEHGLSADKYKDDLLRWSSNHVYVNAYPQDQNAIGLALIEDGKPINWAWADTILAVGKVNLGEHEPSLPPITANLGPSAVIEALDALDAGEEPGEAEDDEGVISDGEGHSLENT